MTGRDLGYDRVMKLWPQHSPKYHARKQHLTQELRDKFKSVGERLVESEVQRRAYRRPEKQQAALAWLEEQRVRRGRSETLKWVFIVLGGIVGIVGIARYLSGK